MKEIDFYLFLLDQIEVVVEVVIKILLEDVVMVEIIIEKIIIIPILQKKLLIMTLKPIWHRQKLIMIQLK
jgi:hypothetical protein